MTSINNNGEKAKIISFINMKGGVGKTTLCKEISNYLYTMKNRSILIVDIDPQSNCTQSYFEKYRIVDLNNKILRHEDSSKLPSIENLFKSRSYLNNLSNNDIILNLQTKENAKLDLIPGDLDTVFMERDQSSGAAEKKLKTYIKQNELRKEYDYIFIDCPPTYSFYTIAAILSSDFYFVPVKPDAYSILGLDLLHRVINDLKIGNFDIFENNPINNLGIIFTLVGGEKGFEKNILEIKDYLMSQNIYFFENEFKYYSKLSTSKLDKFITDREDSDLIEQIENICIEFERRIGEFNE